MSNAQSCSWDGCSWSDERLRDDASANARHELYLRASARRAEVESSRDEIKRLLERIEKLRKLVEDIDCSDLLRHHPWDCPVLWATPGACTCDCYALQHRINEALEDKP